MESSAVENTLALIKPDALNRAQEIERIIIEEGFVIIQKKRVQLSSEQASDFYAEHQGKTFFPHLIAYITSGQIIALCLARENAIQHWRDLLGPTKVSEAKALQPDSIRARFGSAADNTYNAAHGSDSAASAEREIKFFFPDMTLEPILSGPGAKDYLAEAVNPTLLKGLTQLYKEKPQDPVIWLADWLLINNPNKPRIDII